MDRPGLVSNDVRVSLACVDEVEVVGSDLISHATNGMVEVTTVGSPAARVSSGNVVSPRDRSVGSPVASAVEQSVRATPSSMNITASPSRVQERRDHPDSSVAKEGSLRRSKRIRPPAFMGPDVRLVYQWDHVTDGYPYSQPIGIEVLPSDEEIRRRQRHLKRLRDRPRGTSAIHRSTQLRARRLEQLARRYRKQRAISLPPVERPKIHLDADVRWANDGHLFLPFGTTESTVNEQVIFPGSESPVIRGMTFSRAVFYTVPAFAGVWPSKSCKQPIPRLEVDVELTRVVDKEQQCRQLHYDPDSVNLFAFDQQLPPSATCSPWAVQIANYAYRLGEPSFILIPKGYFHPFVLIDV
ncbi:uncharacterized protein DEA37_0014514 [Paragonimus westermani]|uniref:Uncharacterized protein n=1 Tax=Paragonimus westermani TaxID=34504 RepID=A0A5J4P0J2_9TREM|nr:uncharacterized protein DEA37_0014514 [Paragonimus westermani]